MDEWMYPVEFPLKRIRNEHFNEYVCNNVNDFND